MTAEFWGGFVLGIAVSSMLFCAVGMAIYLQKDSFTRVVKQHSQPANNQGVLEVVKEINQDRQNERAHYNRDRESERSANTSFITQQNTMLLAVIKNYSRQLPPGDLQYFREMVQAGYKLYEFEGTIEGFVKDNTIYPFPPATTKTHVTAFREMQGVLELATQNN